MVHFAGIHFLSLGWKVGGTRQAREVQSGPPEWKTWARNSTRVAFRGDGYAGAFHHYQDGDSTHLNPGTPVYAVMGYSPKFRLGTLEQGRVFLYEADTNPSAKTGQDLLDIRGQSYSHRHTRRLMRTGKRCSAPSTRNPSWSNPAIRSSVPRISSGPRETRTTTGHDTSWVSGSLTERRSVRAFWLETGELSRGIMTDPVVTLSVWQALLDERRTEATGGGPRISERLAARLGLAYLSFNAPELEVTGKPHSPIVRLMRRHEFMAMRGGTAGTTLPDPMVWVVQAQGSWRSAGIVPEEARRDFSVGLVAFDADTGATSGRSHRNEPLLEGGGTP